MVERLVTKVYEKSMLNAIVSSLWERRTRDDHVTYVYRYPWKM